jgi:NTE family protein
VPQGRTPFEQIALLLQGGGVLGAYQAGVYEALAEADLHPDWVAGISIGAINSAIIAGNPPKRRVDALREFWHAVSTSPLAIPHFRHVKYDDSQHQLVNQVRAMGILLFGGPNFFVPGMPSPAFWRPGSPDKASYYDNTPLRAHNLEAQKRFQAALNPRLPDPRRGNGPGRVTGQVSRRLIERRTCHVS